MPTILFQRDGYGKHFFTILNQLNMLIKIASTKMISNY